MAQTKWHLVYFINKANKTDFHLVSFISGPTLMPMDRVHAVQQFVVRFYCNRIGIFDNFASKPVSKE